MGTVVWGSAVVNRWLLNEWLPQKQTSLHCWACVFNSLQLYFKYSSVVLEEFFLQSSAQPLSPLVANSREVCCVLLRYLLGVLQERQWLVSKMP